MIAIISHDLTSHGEYHNMMTDIDGIQLFKPKNQTRATGDINPSDYTNDNEITIRDSDQRVMEKFIGTICLDDLSYIFIYFDNIDENQIIQQSKDLNPDQLAYIMCVCKWKQKIETIASAGNNDARIITCACGGHHKLAAIAKQLLAGIDPHSIV